MHYHKQPRRDDNGSDGSRDAVTGGCNVFEGDGRSDGRHRAEVHNPYDQKDQHWAGTGITAVKAEEEAVPASRLDVCRQGTAFSGRLPAAGEVMGFPGGELDRSGNQDDRTGGDRSGASQRGLVHLDRRQRNAQRIDRHSEQGPREEVAAAR